jgi:transposase-like protein
MISIFPVEIPVYAPDFSERLIFKEEGFKGKQIFYLFNSNQRNKRYMRPIEIEQATLIKYLPGIRINPLISDENRSNSLSETLPYTLVLEPDQSICIKETHCLGCGKRLVKNGSNFRKVVLDKWKGKRTYRLMRKRCPKCGEVTPDYSRLIPKNVNYHKNYKSRVRQHYLEGLMPPQIQKVLKVDFGIRISKTTIIRWINKIEKPLRILLRETPVPSSGYWGYDEIHMKIAGTKRYTIDTVDLNTKFVPAARITKNMGRKIGKQVLVEGRKHAQLKVRGLVKDCSTNLGGLFKTRSFKDVKLQNCITHVKWIILRHLKAFAGLPQGSTKPVPKEWSWLIRHFYEVINATTETDIYIKLEILRGILKKLRAERITRLVKAFKQLEKWVPKLIAHQRDPRLSHTNNLLESFHRKYTYYPSFKKHMMTERGAQRVLDYRVFKHNFRRFPEYIKEYELKYSRWKASLPKMRGDKIFQGQGRHFSCFLRKLNKWYREYRGVWQQYFAIL